MGFYLVIFLVLIGCKGNTESNNTHSNTSNDSLFLNTILKKWPSGNFVYQSEKGIYHENWSKVKR